MMSLFRPSPFMEPRLGDLCDVMYDCGPWVFGPGGYLSARPSYTLPYIRAAGYSPGEPRRPEHWVHPVSLPSFFTEPDVKVKTEGEKVVVSASHTFGDADSQDKVQTIRKVDLPESVLGDSVKPVWNRGRLYLQGDWKRTEEEERKAAEKAREEAIALARKQPMELEFKMGGIKPENISVKLVGNRLIVKGVEKSDEDNHFTSQEFCRVITIPEHINADKLRSSITDAGVLRVHAPALDKPPASQVEVTIPLERVVGAEQKSPEKET